MDLTELKKHERHWELNNPSLPSWPLSSCITEAVVAIVYSLHDTLHVHIPRVKARIPQCRPNLELSMQREQETWKLQGYLVKKNRKNKTLT